VLSPSDQHHEISARVKLYLSAGTAIVWVADPEFRTITVHRPQAKPQLFNDADTIDAEPDLPGFTSSVADIFDQQ
jgi:Uma2 family endonuclease